MNIWIVTIGSSDVQLDSDSECRKKDRNEQQRSDKIWRYWYEDEIKPDCHDIPFEPKQSYKDKDEPYRIEARILGTVYEESSSTVRDEIWSYLTFPLLDNFVGELENSSPDAIAVLLTDQSEIFKDKNTRGKQKCAYWQDTCKLEPILRRYFQDKFPQAKYKPIFLPPTSSDKGLDDWNYVLDLVREKLRAIEFDGEEIKNEEIETVYVSHQAGTPAISSAVQFVTLATFRNNVEFLVSNEYSQKTRTISSSTYLGAIQLQEAKALLDRYDYAGVKELLSSYLTPEIQILLDAAIQWNFAEFDKFINKLESYPKFAEDLKERKQSANWYWMAYEAAYLGVVRLKQGNTVEAMFHSFRAVEGLLRQWVDKFYSEEIKQTKHPKWNENERWNRNLNNYGQDLYSFLSIKKTIDTEKNPDIWIFGNKVFNKRNDLFHQLKGLQDKKAVFENWRSPNEKQWRDDAEKKWKARILGCLNFIAEPKPLFISLEEASLMFKVHKELEKAIALTTS